MNEQRVANLAGRIALAGGFLSAVADRLGFWGPRGSGNVAWGDWNHFVANVATLNWFLPAPAIPLLAWVATVAELLLGVLLVVGYRIKWTAYASAILLLFYAITMTIAYGVKVPLDYSVFAASAAAVLVAGTAELRELPRPPKSS